MVFRNSLYFRAVSVSLIQSWWRYIGSMKPRQPLLRKVPPLSEFGSNNKRTQEQEYSSPLIASGLFYFIGKSVARQTRNQQGAADTIYLVGRSIPRKTWKTNYIVFYGLYLHGLPDSLETEENHHNTVYRPAVPIGFI